MGELDEQLESVGVLAEPARRALYEHVVSQPEPVSREQAAEAVGMATHSVKFHLDKLADAGLLDVEYRRLTGRTGPGAGRPAKLYRRSVREVALSVPPRRYDLAGEVLAEAVDVAVHYGVPVAEAVTLVARRTGRRLAGATGGSDPASAAASDPVPHAGSDTRSHAGSEVADDLARTAAVLDRQGYEPRVVDDDLCLANCPFNRLAADHTELVCGMNLALVEGVLDELEADTLHARLAPEPGLCCVKVGS